MTPQRAPRAQVNVALNPTISQMWKVRNAGTGGRDSVARRIAMLSIARFRLQVSF